MTADPPTGEPDRGRPPVRGSSGTSRQPHTPQPDDGAANREGEDGQGADPRHTLRYVARSDRGLVRATNQDSVFAGNRLLVIADGMGGHAAGDTASRLVVAAFAPLNEQPPAPDLLSGLISAAREGNAAIAEVVADNPDLDGMGTTVTAMLFDGDRVGLAHVGDSRAYLYRTGVLHQLSHDDTFVQSLVDDGRITEDEAQHHPQRNLLLRALNGTDLDPSLVLREVRPGDRYLLCSDGLSGVVDAEQIADTLADPDPERTADVLIQRALLRGGPDNVTVIVADVVDTGVAPPPGPVTVGTGTDDPDATGPIGPLTREMPRVPLPPIPEEPAAPTEYLPAAELDAAEEGAGVPGGGNGAGGDEDPDEDPDGDLDEGAPDGDSPSDGEDDASAGRSGPDRGRRRWQRRGALTVAIIALVLVALAGSTLWVRDQYYVGVQDDTVAVFQGVDGSLLGFHFSSFLEDSCAEDAGCTPMRASDLQPGARNLVLAGIPAVSLADARGVIDRLSGQLLPPCPTATGSTSTESGASGTPGTTAGPTGTAAPAGSPPATAPPAGSAGGRSGSGSAGTSADTPTSTAASEDGRSAASKTGAAPARTTSAVTTTTTRSVTERTGTGRTGQDQTSTGRTGAGQTGAGATDQRAASAGPAGQRAGRGGPVLTDAASGSQYGAAPAGIVTVAPPAVTLTVQTTVTPAPAGLAGAAHGGALPAAAPSPATPSSTPSSTPSTDASTGTDTAAPDTPASDTAASGTPTSDTPTTSSGAGSAAETTVTGATPTVTVTQTVTAGPTVTGTPLGPAPSIPGVTCRIVG